MKNSLLLLGDIVFNAKPDAVPFNCRISYKVTQLCMILHLCGRADTCSLVKLHMISHALISKDNMNRLIDFSSSKGAIPIVRFDPAVNKAVMFAIGYGFILQLKNGSYKLTESGRNFAERVLLAGDLMTSEIAEMRRIGKRLTEAQIQEIVNLWRINNDTD